MNLYGFVGNDSVNRLDFIGMKMLYESNKDALANLLKIGVMAYTGNKSSPDIARVKITGEHQIEVKKENESYSAKLKEAAYLVIDVKTVMPSDVGDGTIFKNNQGNLIKFGTGATALMQAHENRRVQSYRDANSTFLEPAEGKGSVIAKCGWVCRSSSQEAKDALVTYLNKTQAEAIQQYNSWIDFRQRGITNEIRQYKPAIEKVGDRDVNVSIFEGFRNIHTWDKPNALWSTNCP
jgi:hypothetical protein